MKKIYSLVLLGLLASVSTVYASDDEGERNHPLHTSAVPLRPLARSTMLKSTGVDGSDSRNNAAVNALVASLLGASFLEDADDILTGGSVASALEVTYFETESPDQGTAFSVLLNLIKTDTTEGVDTADDGAAHNKATAVLATLLDRLYALDQTARTPHCSLKKLATTLDAKPTAAEQLDYLKSLAERPGHTGTVLAHEAAQASGDEDHVGTGTPATRDSAVHTSNYIGPDDFTPTSDSESDDNAQATAQ